MEQPDLIFASKTQDAATLTNLLNADGYNEVEATTLSDAPAAAPAPPAGEPEAPTSSAPAPGSGESAGEEAAGETPGSEQAEPPPPPAAEPAKPKTSGSAKLKARLQTVETEKERLARENEELKRKLATAGKPPETPKPEPPAAPAKPVENKPVDDPEPQLDQFEGDNAYADWTKALARWGYREERRQETKRQQDEQARTETEQKTEAERKARERAQAEETEASRVWNERRELAKSKYADWDQVEARAKDTPISAALATAVRDYERGPEIGYWLVTHPEEAARLTKLTETAASVPIYEFRAKLRLAYQELDKLDAQIATEAPAAEAPAPGPEGAPPATDASREARVAAATPPNPPAPAAPQQPAAAAPPPKKHTPPSTVGNRGTPTVKKLAQMTREEIAQMSDEEYRKRREAGET